MVYLTDWKKRTVVNDLTKEEYEKYCEELFNEISVKNVKVFYCKDCKKRRAMKTLKER